ncbi:TetR/AcrR family transcriptional regulator [Pseudohalioglobus lutimaris]|uniref:TetR/AcrR family transcriptional regulator n=1 Tax=Pseudohalioglobus lutimaris TaxID=1737061 RepID=A0A2N5X411_9GAMM|nr:TetR/AcrR family transcriptional regulator [Pseudohalioglobus lutimaris]PLW69231.1 TetR/AcrR family transcriptional regulator [Pseudohalioglobus lutimaris]
MQPHYGIFMGIVETQVGRREKRKQEIRARIEDAAYRLFQRHGIEETSIEHICQEADVARRTFYGHFPNKHALLGGLGINRLYSRSETMLRELMANQHTTRGRLEAMIDYIESSFASMNNIDRQLVLVGPTAFAEDQERQREIGNSAMASFTELIRSGVELGDVNDHFSADMLATTVVGTLNMITISWCMDENYPVFAKLEEARRLFDNLICKDGA